MRSQVSLQTLAARYVPLETLLVEEGLRVALSGGMMRSIGDGQTNISVRACCEEALFLLRRCLQRSLNCGAAHAALAVTNTIVEEMKSQVGQHVSCFDYLCVALAILLNV